MGRFLIIKTGTALPHLVKNRGDWDRWIVDLMGLEADRVEVSAVFEGNFLPLPREICGCVITGSNRMVTDHEPWSEMTAQWLKEAMARGLPVMGICFGHQLLAYAAGGVVDYHPAGIEIGAAPLRLTEAAGDDPVFGEMPEEFPAHMSHSQSVIRLPQGASVLATNDHGPHQVFRVGERAWGVQFHPEFDSAVMQAYVQHRRIQIAREGKDPERVLAGITDTPAATSVLRRFRDYCEQV